MYTPELRSGYSYDAYLQFYWVSQVLLIFSSKFSSYSYCKFSVNPFNRVVKYFSNISWILFFINYCHLHFTTLRFSLNIKNLEGLSNNQSNLYAERRRYPICQSFFSLKIDRSWSSVARFVTKNCFSRKML